MSDESLNDYHPQQYPPAQPDSNGRFRGAFPSKIQTLIPPPEHATGPYPAEYAVVPPKRSMFGNDQYGDCVTAEEAENINSKTFEAFGAGGEQVISTANVVAYCRRHGTLNGASLTEVLDSLQVSRKDGLIGTDGKMYCVGPYSRVDYTNEDNLRSAVSQSPVKIGVDATPLNGSGDGWTITGGRSYRNEDHAIHVCGYGTPAFLYAKLGKPVPSNLSPTQTYYLLYTWSMLFVVDHASLKGFTAEAWLRSPDVYADGVLVVAPTPTPVPPPGPGPTPPPVPVGNVLTLATPLPAGQYAIVPAAAVVLSNAEVASLQACQSQLAAITGRLPATT